VRSRRDQREPDRQPASPELPDGEMAAVAAAALLEPTIIETIPISASVVRLEPGLFAVEVAGATAPPSAAAGKEGPWIWLGQFAPEIGEGLVTLSAQGSGAQWLQAGTTRVAIHVPKAGQLLGAMSLGSSVAPRIAIRSLDSALLTVTPTAAPPSEGVTLPPHERDIRAEVTAHIERVGDRVFAGTAWAGALGQQRRVEGFSIRPLHEIQPFEIEYKALHPGGIETPWVRGPQFCGTRGRGLPLTGFAVRIAPHVQDQFSAIYRAAFFRGGISEPRSNGAPCLPGIDGDTIEAISVRIVQRRPG